MFHIFIAVLSEVGGEREEGKGKREEREGKEEEEFSSLLQRELTAEQCECGCNLCCVSSILPPSVAAVSAGGSHLEISFAVRPLRLGRCINCLRAMRGQYVSLLYSSVGFNSAFSSRCKEKYWLY